MELMRVLLVALNQGQLRPYTCTHTYTSVENSLCLLSEADACVADRS